MVVLDAWIEGSGQGIQKTVNTVCVVTGPQSRVVGDPMWCVCNTIMPCVWAVPVCVCVMTSGGVHCPDDHVPNGGCDPTLCVGS